MRDRLIELISQADEECKHTKDCKHCSGYGKGALCMNYHIADHLLENGVIVPPINRGDNVWVLESTDFILTPKELYKGFVMNFDIREYGRFMMIRLETDVDYQIHAFPFECFGKTVFLTREEAEKALERSKG